jgi:hypothetical protein
MSVTDPPHSFVFALDKTTARKMAAVFIIVSAVCPPPIRDRFDEVMKDFADFVEALNVKQASLEARTRTLKREKRRLLEQRDEARRLVRILFDQLRGGHCDPKTEINHPGHLLIRLLGWVYDGPETGRAARDVPTEDIPWNRLKEEAEGGACFWTDPTRGTGKVSTYCLTQALSIACRRLLDWPDEGYPGPHGKTCWDKLSGDEDLV